MKYFVINHETGEYIGCSKSMKGAKNLASRHMSAKVDENARFGYRIEYPSVWKIEAIDEVNGHYIPVITLCAIVCSNRWNEDIGSGYYHYPNIKAKDMFDLDIQLLRLKCHGLPAELNDSFMKERSN